MGYVGTVDWKKLHPNFIQMCIAINIPDVRFTIIGENNTLICGDKFVFYGKVDDVAPYLAEMDVFGYPLRSDHYGTCEQVLGEAMAAGVVPVVMSNPAEKLIVANGITGFIVHDEKDYVSCIEYLYRTPMMRDLMAHNARLKAETIYSIDTMIGKWNKVFEEMMEKPKKEREPL